MPVLAAETEHRLVVMAFYIDSERYAERPFFHSDMIVHVTVEVVETAHDKPVVAHLERERKDLEKIGVDTGMHVDVVDVEHTVIRNEKHFGHMADKLVLMDFEVPSLHEHLGPCRGHVEIHVGKYTHMPIGPGRDISRQILHLGHHLEEPVEILKKPDHIDIFHVDRRAYGHVLHVGGIIAQPGGKGAEIRGYAQGVDIGFSIGDTYPGRQVIKMQVDVTRLHGARIDACPEIARHEHRHRIHAFGHGLLVSPRYRGTGMALRIEARQLIDLHCVEGKIEVYVERSGNRRGQKLPQIADTGRHLSSCVSRAECHTAQHYRIEGGRHVKSGNTVLGRI